MKTKTNSFTKVINFCVLVLFFISTLIFFTSCDNGNSPNDNTNEEQNNTQNTDYCEICDGLQTENCGINHKCDDENCVEYSDNKIYKNGHTHDYCERTDCDGSTHMGADHPTGPTYPDWFKKITIGGEDSPYKVFVIDNNAYNKTHDFTAEEKINDYLGEYIKYINGLTLNKELTGDVESNLEKIKTYPTTQKLNLLIGTTADDTGTIYSEVNGINDICKQAIEKIINNVGSGDTAQRDKAFFALYYRAIANEAYRNGYNGELTTKNQNGIYDTNTANQMENQYNEEKNKCISLYGGDGNNLPFNNKYFYDETGNLNPEVVQQFNTMVITAANELGVSENEAQNIISLSFTASSVEGILDKLCPSIKIDPETCLNNQMVDITDFIGFPEVGKMTQPAKLNKSIFSQDYGRELV